MELAARFDLQDTATPDLCRLRYLARRRSRYPDREQLSFIRFPEMLGVRSIPSVVAAMQIFCRCCRAIHLASSARQGGA
jgi:hypothetical protein